MGQALHGSATTTAAVRRAIQTSSESLRALSKRYGINPKTVAKWRKRTGVADLPTGPRSPSSTVLSPATAIPAQGATPIPGMPTARGRNRSTLSSTKGMTIRFEPPLAT